MHNLFTLKEPTSQQAPLLLADKLPVPPMGNVEFGPQVIKLEKAAPKYRGKYEDMLLRFHLGEWKDSDMIKQARQDFLSIHATKCAANACSNDAIKTQPKKSAHEKLARSTALPQMKQFMNTIEKMTHDEDITPEEHARCNLFMPIKEVEITFLAISKNSLAKLEKLENQVVLQNVCQYACNCSHKALAALFGETEQQYSQFTSQCPIDRNTLIIIDGMTVYERMQKAYKMLQNEPGEFDQWYQEQGKQMGNVIVSTALMAGKNVYAFVPNTDGNLPDNPIRLKGGGNFPDDSSEAFKNHWDDLADLFGIEPENATIGAFVAAKKRMQAHYAAGRGEAYFRHHTSASQKPQSKSTPKPAFL